jgi:DNA-binding NarL/FixJ family response regulator
MATKIRLVIAEDHAILREGLRSIFDEYPEFEVVGEASDGLEAIRLCVNLTPDLLLLDFSMPRMNGLEAIADIKKESPRTKILMLTCHDSVDYLALAFEAGADGYALKDIKHPELLRAIRILLQGKKFVPEAMAVKYEALSSLAAGKRQESGLASILTKREKEILKMVAEGYSNKEIASFLYISPKTVDNHRTSIMGKLDLHSAQALTLYAIHIGLVEVRKTQATPQ